MRKELTLLAQVLYLHRNLAEQVVARPQRRREGGGLRSAEADTLLTV